MKRKQLARDPVTLGNWKDFVDFFNLTTEPTAVAGMGFGELCDAISGQGDGEKPEWDEWYERYQHHRSHQG